jgi:hypothetical protein
MPSRDRLAELLAGCDNNEEEEEEEKSSKDHVRIDIFHKQRPHAVEYEAIRASLAIIRHHTTGILTGIVDESNAADTRKRALITKRIEALMEEANKHANQIKLTLDTCKAANVADVARVPANESPSATLQIRLNEYTLHLRQFHDIMLAYNQAVTGFKKHLETRTRRELRIIDHNLSEDRIDQIIISGNARQVRKKKTNIYRKGALGVCVTSLALAPQQNQ